MQSKLSIPNLFVNEDKLFGDFGWTCNMDGPSPWQRKLHLYWWKIEVRKENEKVEEWWKVGLMRVRNMKAAAVLLVPRRRTNH